MANRHNPAPPIWMWVAALFLVLCVVCLALVYAAPDLATLGLRMELTRPTCKKLLDWLMPRSSAHILRSYEYYEPSEWYHQMVRTSKELDKDPRARDRFASLMAETNAKGLAGYAAIHFATLSDSRGLLESLLSQGADPNAATDGGETALHLAVMEGNHGVVNLLLERGAEVDPHDGLGRTPLHLAAASLKPGFTERLIAAGADVDVRDENDWTPLHYAARASQVAAGKLLVAANASIMSRDKDGNAPLHVAVGGEFASFLLSVGADLNATNSLGQTPLHLAARTGGRSLVVALLAGGVDPAIRDVNGKTALDLATAVGTDALTEVDVLPLPEPLGAEERAYLDEQRLKDARDRGHSEEYLAVLRDILASKREWWERLATEKWSAYPDWKRILASSLTAERREYALRKKCGGLSKGMARNQVSALLGEPTAEEEQRVGYAANPRGKMLPIGIVSARDLTEYCLWLYFDDEGRLKSWMWLW